MSALPVKCVQSCTFSATCHSSALTILASVRKIHSVNFSSMTKWYPFVRRCTRYNSCTHALTQYAQHVWLNTHNPNQCRSPPARRALNNLAYLSSSISLPALIRVPASVMLPQPLCTPALVFLNILIPQCNLRRLAQVTVLEYPWYLMFLPVTAHLFTALRNVCSTPHPPDTLTAHTARALSPQSMSSKP